MAKEHGPRLLASVKALAPAMEELRARAQGILDRLFPEEAEARQFKEELSILDAAMAKGALTTENHRRAVEALRHEFRSEEHTSELQSLMRTSSAVFCMKKKPTNPH